MCTIVQEVLQAFSSLLELLLGHDEWPFAWKVGVVELFKLLLQRLIQIVELFVASIALVAIVVVDVEDDIFLVRFSIRLLRVARNRYYFWLHFDRHVVHGDYERFLRVVLFWNSKNCKIK